MRYLFQGLDFDYCVWYKERRCFKSDRVHVVLMAKLLSLGKAYGHDTFFLCFVDDLSESTRRQIQKGRSWS